MAAEPCSLDKIRLKKLRVPCIIGIFEKERKHSQDLIIDITLFVDLRQACCSDNINDTVDYAVIEKQVVHFVGKSRFQLLEKLVDSIARICFDDLLVQQVIVRVEKPAAPVMTESISVEINRRRKDYE